MDKQNKIACTGVTQITLSNGKVSIDFSNQAVNLIPAKEGNFLSLDLPLHGFLHMAACINQMIDRMKENGIIKNSGNKTTSESVSEQPAKPTKKTSRKASSSVKTEVVTDTKVKSTPRRKIERKTSAKKEA